MTKSVFWQKRKEKRRSAYCFERKKKRNFSLIEDHSRGIGGPPALLAHGEQRPYYSYHKKKKNSHNIRCFILAKMKNTSSKFHQNFIQFSNFAFIHFSFFNFKFIQLRYFRQFWLNSFKKNSRKYFSIITFFFNLKMLKKKKFR